MSETALTKISIDVLPHIAEGKVRGLYEVDSKTLLFVASDRISAYDVIMGNVGSLPFAQDTLLTNPGHPLQGLAPHAPLSALVRCPPNHCP